MKTLICVLLATCFYSPYCQAETLDLPDETPTEHSLLSKGAYVWTADVTLEKQTDGNLYHVAWYSDGFVATTLTGKDTGLQAIFANGQLLDFSKTFSTYANGFSHFYWWGKVNSFDGYQEIISN